jgi:hypothetical protein
MVLFTLVAHRQHDDFRHADDFMQRDIPGGSERDDQFALGWVLGRFAEAEGRDRQPVQRGRPDGVDCSPGAIEVFGCVGLVEQEVEAAFQVSSSRRRYLNLSVFNIAQRGKASDDANIMNSTRLACVACRQQ